MTTSGSTRSTAGSTRDVRRGDDDVRSPAPQEMRDVQQEVVAGRAGTGTAMLAGAAMLGGLAAGVFRPRPSSALLRMSLFGGAVALATAGVARLRRASPVIPGRTGEAPGDVQDVTGGGVPGGRPDAITFLREEHVRVLAMLDELENEPADGRPVTPDDVDARQRLVTELVMAESAHEAIEEEYFWPSVQRWLEDGHALARPALEQEQSAKHVLDRLDGLEVGDPVFENLVSQIIADGREHIAYEEREVWPILRQKVDPVALEELGEKMADAKRTAPTRPHPRTPPRPGVLKSAGAAAAATDRVRDAATGRGQE